MPSLPLSIPPRRILLIKPSAIGDVVHALPILNLLRRKWPNAHIAWLLTPASAGLLKNHPQLDEIILFERRRFGQGWWNPRAAAGLGRFTWSLRRRQFDLVIDLQGLFRSGWLAWHTRAATRIGFANARELAWLFYTHRVPVETMEQHAISRYLHITRALGCDDAPLEFHFGIGDAERGAIAQHLPQGSRYAVLLPATNWETKRWPVEHFAALVKPLRERHGLQSVVAGGPDAALLARLIPGALDLTGKTSLPELVALLERASLVIANDSGPMHIAAALGRPLVTLFGPTNPLRTGPFNRPDTVLRLDIPCSPCYSRTCSHQSCLRWLGPMAVLAEASKQLQRG